VISPTLSSRAKKAVREANDLRSRGTCCLLAAPELPAKSRFLHARNDRLRQSLHLVGMTVTREGLKRTLAILAALLIGQSSHAQEKKPWDIDRLCGRLEHVQKVPDRKNANTFSENRKPLREVSVSLYGRRENEPCCAGLNALETIQTRKGGRFEFKTTRPGNYWLGMNWSGKEYRLGVVYKPQKNSTTMCSEQGIGLDDEGNADWWVTLTVD